MPTTTPASHQIDALERRVAKLEAQSQPLGKTCPKCHAFGLGSYVRKGLQMMRCRFCDFEEEKMRQSEQFAPCPHRG
jgi:hypothetical protein